MLDHNKLLKEFKNYSSKLFPDLSEKKALAYQTWEKITDDAMFSERALAAKSSFLIPGWMSNLNDSYEIKADIKKYTVLAVDGSQVYPDRNMPGGGCFLLNTGGMLLDYGENSSAKVFSEPKLFTPDELTVDNGPFSKDLVDLKREELELKEALGKALEFRLDTETSSACLFDGSLIFWHLESKPPEICKRFLDLYLYYLHQFYEKKILIAGFISLPKSKELVNLIKLGLCRFTVADCIGCHRDHETFPCQEVNNLLDTQIVRTFLRPHQRTTLFWSTSKVTKSYPDHLKPYFFYLNIGEEIARVEIPAWIAQDQKHLTKVCEIALDQSLKGRGYPVCLAEAHEQAVIKGPDRNFFYHLVFKAGIENKKKVLVSQKSLKKRGIGI